MYTAGILPFVVAATIFGAARFRQQAERLSLWILAGAACLAIYSPILSLPRDVRALHSPLVSAKSQALSLIPGQVPVSASNQLGGHLSARRYSYIFPTVGQARWIILDVRDGTYIDSNGYKRLIRAYRDKKEWRTVFSSHGVFVLHKR
jgi:hypothetical protein